MSFWQDLKDAWRDGKPGQMYHPIAPNSEGLTVAIVSVLARYEKLHQELVRSLPGGSGRPQAIRGYLFAALGRKDTQAATKDFLDEALRRVDWDEVAKALDSDGANWQAMKEAMKQ